MLQVQLRRDGYSEPLLEEGRIRMILKFFIRLLGLEVLQYFALRQLLPILDDLPSLLGIDLLLMLQYSSFKAKTSLHKGLWLLNSFI